MRSPAAVSTATTRPPSPTILPTGVPRRTSAAPAAVEVEEVAGNLRRDDAAHQPVGRFEHGHRLAEEPRRGRDLEADEAAADHDHVLRRVQPVAQRAGLGGDAEDVDAGEVRPLDRRKPRAGAGGERQAIEVRDRAVGRGGWSAPAASIDSTSAARTRRMAFFS